MIRLKISNFQNIEKGELNIEGITLLVGSNNHGKSAIVRALVAALYNRAGKGFIRDGAKKCTVEITLSQEPGLDPLTLVWTKKGVSGGTYVVNGEHFKKLGRSVPPPITDGGIKETVTGPIRARLQFWGQWEPPFLVQEPGSHLYEFFSRFRRESQVGDAIVAMRTDLKTWEKNAVILESNIVLMEAGIATKVTQIASLRKKAGGKKGIVELKNTVELYNKILRDCSDHVRVTQKIQDVEARIAKLLTTKITVIAGVDKLCTFLEEVTLISKIASDIRQVVAHLRRIAERLAAIHRYAIAYRKLVSLQEQAGGLQEQAAVVLTIQATALKLQQTKKRQRCLKNEQRLLCNKLQRVITDCGGICPVCLKPFGDSNQ